MRKLILEVQVSIDGFMASVDGNTNWMVWNWGPEWTWDKKLQQYHTALTTSADCILLSRQMAEEGFIAHWKRTAENFDSPQLTFAKHVAETYKVVFSKSLTKLKSIPGGWNNADISSGDLVTEINNLKDMPGSDILVYGGASFVSSLISANLVDEFHILVNPVVIGNGLSMFKSIDNI